MKLAHIHPEADQQITRTLDVIRSKGKKSGIALNPGTSIESVIELFSLVDYVMVMTVNPGFSGQKYLEFTNKKIRNLVSLGREYDFKVMVDGAITPDRIKELSSSGVTGFILGTSSVFGKDEPYEMIFDNIRKL